MTAMALPVVLSILACIVLTKGEFRLQIVHNSDVHARFEQTDANYGLCTEEEQRAEKCFGGFPRTRTAIEMAKAEAASEHIPTIVLNAGDFFVGTAYYDLKKWALTAPMVEALRYDVIVSLRLPLIQIRYLIPRIHSYHYNIFIGTAVQ